ARTKQT
nr:Chain C, Histone H3 [Saccharomyces cerevisiae]